MSTGLTFGRAFLRGLLAAIASTALTEVVLFLLLLLWLNQFDVRPDFGTNGLLWITTTILSFTLVLLPLLLLVLYCIILPFSAKAMNGQAFGVNYRRVTLIAVALLQVAVLSVFLRGSSLAIWLIWIVPVVLITAVTSIALFALLNDLASPLQVRVTGKE